MPELRIEGDQVRAVVLDVDGTLYQQGPVRRAMMARLARAHWRRPRSGLSATRILAAYRRAQESLRSSAFEGDVSKAQVEMAAEKSGVDEAAVVACVDQWMETAPLDLVAASARDGLADALDAMADRGLKLAVVSDYPPQRKLQALGIADRFDSVVSAQDERVQAFKPNPKGILVALQDLGVGPADALYVGDREDVDAPAAAAADVRCALIGTSREQAGEQFLRVSDFRNLVDILRDGTDR